MQPRHDKKKSGYMALVDLGDDRVILELEQYFKVRKVLTAGASLGLVQHDDDHPQRYYIRSELFEYLSSVRARETKLGKVQEEKTHPVYVNQIAEGTTITSGPVLEGTVNPAGPVREQPLAIEKEPRLIEYHRKIDVKREIRQEFLKRLQIPAELVEKIEWQDTQARLRQFDNIFARAGNSNKRLGNHLLRLTEELAQTWDETRTDLKARYEPDVNNKEFVDDIAQDVLDYAKVGLMWRTFHGQSETEDGDISFINVSDGDYWSRVDDWLPAIQSMSQKLESNFSTTNNTAVFNDRPVEKIEEILAGLRQNALDYREIQERFQTALGIPRNMFSRLDNIRAGRDPSTWQDYVESAERGNDTRGTNLARIFNEKRQLLLATEKTLTEEYTGNAVYQQYIKDEVEKHRRLLNGLAVLMVYEGLVKNAKDAAGRKNALEVTNAHVDEAAWREIQSLGHQIEEAMERKLDGWADLEAATTKLTLRLNDLHV